MFNWNLDENFIWFLKNELLIIFRFQNQQLWRNSPSQLNLSKTILPMQAVWSHWKVLTTGIDLWKMSWCFKSLIESVDHLKGILNLVKLKILLFDAWHMQKSELFIESPFLPYCHRFRDGLKTLGVLEQIQNHPESFSPVMCYNPRPLTADQVDGLFHIRWSEEGSNQKREERTVVAFWRDYLQDVEGMCER